MSDSEVIRQHPESAQAHHRSVGGVLVGLGLFFSLFAAAGLWLVDIQFGFISGEALLTISAIYVGLGLWMRIGDTETESDVPN